MTKEICMHCMNGYIINGVCNRCGKSVQNSDNRRCDALPLKYCLHNRYILGDVLGWGGFGITYVAWDIEQKHPVAIKELYPSSFVSRDKEYTVCPHDDSAQVMSKMKESFYKEAMLMIRLQNLHGIVKMYHVFDDNNTIYFSMELLQGVDFRQYLKEHGKMQWDNLSKMMYPILRGLNELHKEGLIHRDISPDNIFICNDGSTRLIDFGLARKFDGDISFTVSMKECFAPWEQYDSHGKQGPWTDIYAIGVTFYFALTGVLPPAAPDRIAKTKRTIPLSEICTNIPCTVATSIEKAMEIKIEKRYQTISQFCGDLYAKQSIESAQSITNLKLICKQGDLVGHYWPIRINSPMRIGRGNGVEIILPPNSMGISRLHCTLLLNQDGKILLKDENSSYGTTVNGVSIQPHVWYSLLKGSWIMIGQYIFQIQ